MGRHLTACKAKKEEYAKTSANKKEKDLIYHIKISGYKVYWLNIEMKGTNKLSDLDAFLRDIWLECCGHLSEFIIDGVRYSFTQDNGSGIYSDLFSKPEKSMKVQLKKVLGEKDTFTYDYDFGSTTHLEGQVVAIREGYLKKPVKILARNNPFELHCEQCEKTAYWLCIECEYFYCDRCLQKHECGDEMGLPVVNSPRMGVCGYNGESDFDNFSLTTRS